MQGIHILIGASSQIVQSLIADTAKRYPTDRIIGISRAECPSDLSSLTTLTWKKTPYDEASIAVICAELLEEIKPQSDVFVRRVVIANGVLHDEHMPEKRLASISLEHLSERFLTNAFIPILWLKSLEPLLKHNSKADIQTKVVVFSARVGSISDNQLGGWHSYRASKAALNMLLKNAALEWKNKLKHVQIIIFHPGTTDTPLSKPFQRNVPEHKLFSPEFVATQLLDLLELRKLENEIQYLDWENKSIPW